GNEVIDAASAASVLGGHVELQLLELLNRVLNRGVVDTAAEVLIGHAVDEKAVEIFANSVDHGAMPIFHHGPLYVDSAGSLLHQVIHVAAVQGQIADLRRVHCGSQLGVFRVDGASFAGDFDHF